MRKILLLVFGSILSITVNAQSNKITYVLGKSTSNTSAKTLTDTSQLANVHANRGDNLLATRNDNGDDNITVSDAYPNPADNLTVLSYSLIYGSPNAKVVVIDMVGNEVIVIPVTEKEGSIKIETEKLLDGVYFYSFVNENKAIYTKRLVVRHL